MDWFRLIVGQDGQASPLQMCARAVILLVFGIACVRIAGRRTFAQATPLDIIVAIIVGSNLSRMMTGRADLVGGAAATLVLVLLHRALARAVLVWPSLAPWLKSQPVILVRDGKADKPAMARHGVSDDDLLESLRSEQVEEVAKVRMAMLEGGGKISVVPKA